MTTEQFEAFRAALEALCAEHRVHLRGYEGETNAVIVKHSLDKTGLVESELVFDNWSTK